MLANLFSVILLTSAVAPPEIRTARDLRALPVTEVQPPRPVRLTGVVTFSSPGEKYFYLQDDTGGVRVEGTAERDLRPGDVVEVVGWPTPGTYLPETRAVQVVIRGQAPLPKPVAFTLSADDTPYMDGRRVEVVAVVQRAWCHGPWLQLDLGRGRGHGIIQIPGPTPGQLEEAAALSGAVVRVRGVCKVNTKQRAVSGPPSILADGLNTIEQLEKPPDKPFDQLPTTARDLMLFNPDPIKARRAVRVDGIVTFNQGNRQFYVYDGTGVVYALFTEPVNLNRGDRVKVVGFPRLATDPIRLENSRVWVTGSGSLPPAMPATPAAGRDGKHEGHVARFTGLVHEVTRQGDWETLILVADGLTFTAIVVENSTTRPLPAPGSKVEVSGVVTRLPLEGVKRNAFAVMVRSDGLTVLEPPPLPPEPPPPSWWTGRRVAYLTAGFFGLFLLGGATVTALRVQVRRAAELARRQSEQNQKLEGQLKVAARLEAVGRVAGGVAHDFNNILTVINGCAQLLDEEIASDPTHAATLAADIRRAGRLATALTRLLLTFSRQRPISVHSLDLNAVIADAAPILARLLGTRAELRVIPQPNLPETLAETGMVLQILINLAANAGEAMPDGGAFTLTTSTPEPGWVRLTAADSGEGMTDEVKARAFDRGFTTKAAGTGTGLSTVADIVQILGGRIRCRSERGRGTEFEIDLPISGSALALPPHRSSGELPPNQFDVPSVSSSVDDTVPTNKPPVEAGRPVGPVVLLVEDDDSIRALVQHILEHSGLRVLPAADAQEALQVLAGHPGPIDLLVTDLAMNGQTGQELALRVRAARPSVRVLFMSGHTPDESFLETVRANHSDFLHKPFAPAELLELAWRLLGQPA